jgi:transposase-like protein
VLESENAESWTWFLENLRKAIGTPNGLVISSDMQKGLEIAIMQIYPHAEHRECIRHLYNNFKKKISWRLLYLQALGCSKNLFC